MPLRKTNLEPETVDACLQVLDQNQQQASENCQIYHCTLVTPMYGGGVVAGMVDSKMPIRATAIRGQLRHWWRLLNRKNFESSQALFKAERAIWGGLGNKDTLAASKVGVSVRAKSIPANMLKGLAGYPGYTLFPAAAETRANKPEAKLLKEGFTFELVLRFSTSLDKPGRDQALEALRWWATFGGVGARARRGCGAVILQDEQHQLLSVKGEEVAKMGWQLQVGAAKKDAVDAWKSAVQTLSDFRQGAGFARNSGGGKGTPGRSRWPEPDAIRRITGMHSDKHTPEHPAGNVFPRAAFGLPIITHFKVEKADSKDTKPNSRDAKAKDPVDTTLKPIPDGRGEAVERMASPLILRPMFHNNGWCPAALCLNRDHVARMGLSLEGNSRNLPHRIAPGQWQDRSAANRIPPLKGKADAIDAFIDYFASCNPPGAAKPISVMDAVVRTNHAQGVAGVQLRRNARNQALTAKHVKTNKEWTATGERAQALFQALPTEWQEKLQKGLFIMVDIEAAGTEILAIRERA